MTPINEAPNPAHLRLMVVNRWEFDGLPSDAKTRQAMLNLYQTLVEQSREAFTMFSAALNMAQRMEDYGVDADIGGRAHIDPVTKPCEPR